MRYLGVLFFALLSFAAYGTEQSPSEQQAMARAKQIWDSLDRQHGTITLPDDVATLHVPDRFYYLSPKDSETVLVTVWGNPAGAGSSTLGMLFPEGVTPFDAAGWGVTIRYEEDGYVSDENADAIDYDELLSQMQMDTAAASKRRVAQGYAPIQLVGWAAKPFYDKLTHKMYWAKELKIGDEAQHALNYNIRVLGRKGVLVLNFIAGMAQKDLIDSQLDTVLALADFNQGSRYEDFDPSMDKVAAYGLGALVAGKVIAKTGLIAAALIFLKKFGIIFLAGVGAAFSKLFRNKKTA